MSCAESMIAQIFGIGLQKRSYLEGVLDQSKQGNL